MDSDFHKRTITFTKPQMAWLQAEAQRIGITVAELVRRIVDEHRDSGQRRSGDRK